MVTKKPFCGACQTYKTESCFVDYWRSVAFRNWTDIHEAHDYLICLECRGYKSVDGLRAKKLRKEYPTFFQYDPNHADYQRAYKIFKLWGITCEQLLEFLIRKEWRCHKCDMFLEKYFEVSIPNSFQINPDYLIFCRRCAYFVRKEHKRFI